MNMKDETALKILEIAAQLAAATANGGAQYKTASRERSAAPNIEGAFADCLDAVRVHFEDLTAGQK
jgi:hypothetical protein